MGCRGYHGVAVASECSMPAGQLHRPDASSLSNTDGLSERKVLGPDVLSRFGWGHYLAQLHDWILGQDSQDDHNGI